MAIPSVLKTAYSGLVAAKAGIATTGHNIANANTEGYSRQRTVNATTTPNETNFGTKTIGTGTKVARIERVNDEYLEKQIRNASKELQHFEEKDTSLRQVEDIFNELGDDGLNRLMSRFFNEFRKLADEPESPAIRNSVKEATQAVINNFHRLRNEVDEVRKHLDTRIESYVGELNSLASNLCELNEKIKTIEVSGGSPNDLLDKRDLILKKLAAFVDMTSFKDKLGRYNIDLKGIGPFVSGIEVQPLSVARSPADQYGKVEGALEINSAAAPSGHITHKMTGGRLGALIETRDNLLSSILDRLDELAYSMSEEVNNVHRQGYNLDGIGDISFFKPLIGKERAAELISLSDDVLASTDNIAAAMEADSPGDNRIALAISKLQTQRVVNDGKTTFDEWYNSIVSDVGVASAGNHFSLNQQKDIVTQLSKMRDQVSGVSVDEETTNLLEFQHVFDASAKVIQASDEMLKTILSLKRD